MTLDLESRLHAYRPTLDDAIDGARSDDRPVRRRHRASLAAAALVVIAGAAGLVAQAKRDGAPSSGSTPSDATTLWGPSAPFGVAPFFVLDDPRYVPVEFEGLVSRLDPSRRSGGFMYASVVDGAVATVEVGVSTYVRVGTQDTEPVQVRGEPGVARQAGESVVVQWQDATGVGAYIAVPGTDVDEALALADGLVVGDEAAWYAALDAIMTVDDPLIEAWRAERRERFCNEPIEIRFSEDVAPGCG